ncbi:hypothetical protein NDK47_05890 [Brevibacillus ruminantium]|uniref:Uncharacterized protein n=1 Tax=Brevibacillus ruminantium TaxID=2950604 RepID=A0ABY4WN58_9BACL|nr:hypothetical protein [Brevibacillus ruminantium]USG66829.1 hypothetical protein NDK47_05890 [Brevibacillus ruminantium]
MNLLFGDNYISYVIDGKNGMSFNIFGVQDIRKHDSSLKDQVTSLAFNNSNIKVIDYKVDTGISDNGFRLVNMIVTAQVLTDHIEKADKLLIQFQHEKTTTHEFGEITVQNSVPFQNEHLVPFGDYKVGYPTPALDVNIKNAGKQSISVSQVYDLTDKISYQFKDAFEIKPEEVKQIVIDSLRTKKEHDFITMTPILSYRMDDKEYLYNMPGVLYGILDSDQDKIKKITQQLKE